MKWFHHECATRFDPKINVLQKSRGHEGLSVYWCLLEEIGMHSDTFHLKIAGINKEADELFSELVRYPRVNPDSPFGKRGPLRAVPHIQLSTLADRIIITPRKLRSLIGFYVKIGLFDARKWLEYNVLNSAAFERRGDDYSRRIKRNAKHGRRVSEHPSDNVRTISEHKANTLRTTSESPSENVPSDTEAEQEQEKKEIKNKTDKTLLTQAPDVDNSGSQGSRRYPRASTAADESYLIDLDNESFNEYSSRFHSIINLWNNQHPAHSIDWEPNPAELTRLFCFGEYEYKLSMCLQAYKLLGEKLNYAELVIRALCLMLQHHRKAKILNPYGWLWTCLHGRDNGTRPWVHLITAEEEKSISQRTERSPQ